MGPRKQTDDEAAEFYAQSENQVVEPGGGKRTRPNLTAHVPIRFQPDVVEKVRICATYDGMTVSSWMRAAVGRAATIRLAQIAPSETAPSATIITFHRTAPDYTCGVMNLRMDIPRDKTPGGPAPH